MEAVLHLSHLQLLLEIFDVLKVKGKVIPVQAVEALRVA
jgi:hypothetical protein